MAATWGEGIIKFKELVWLWEKFKYVYKHESKEPHSWEKTEATGKNKDNLCSGLQSRVQCFMGIGFFLGKEQHLFA